MCPAIFSAADTPVPKTSAEIIEAVKTNGASSVIKQLFDSAIWTKVVYPGISSGEADWLEVAKILRPVTDAGASEEMDDALARALLRQPYAVLPILNELWWKNSDMCYFGWDSELPAKSVRSYVHQLERALINKGTKSNSELRERCLKGIAKTRQELQRNKL